MPAAALAFSPLGLTVTFTAANSVPTSAQAPSSAPTTRPAYQYRVHNVGTEVVLLGVGVDNATAVAKAASIGAGAVPIAPTSVTVLGFPAGSFFTGKTASSTSVVYVTPGEGL
jgi:hypothetical protein